MYTDFLEVLNTLQELESLLTSNNFIIFSKKRSIKTCLI